MKVYPLLCTEWDINEQRDVTIVVEVFSSYDAAYNYATMLAETDIKYGHQIPDVPQNNAVRYEANRLQGYVKTYDKYGHVVTEFSIWAEEVRNMYWHA